MKSIIPQSIKFIHSLFRGNGKKLYVVGGAIRDYLNGSVPDDFDLCTDALPDEIIGILSPYMRITSVGKSFFVIIAYPEDYPFGLEIATFRQDEYNFKNRFPIVKPSDIKGDVLRRDFTINSLFYDLDNDMIVDLTGGKVDLENKIVRFIGDANLRIAEDPLRIIRATRIAYKIGGIIDEETLRSIKINKSKVLTISKERIWKEIEKAWGYGGDFGIFINLLTQCELWDVIFPNFKINYEKNIPNVNDLCLYLSNLLKYNKLDINKLIENYSIPSIIARKIKFLTDILDIDNYDVIKFFSQKKQLSIDDELILLWLEISELKESKIHMLLKINFSSITDSVINDGFVGKNISIEVKNRILSIIN